MYIYINNIYIYNCSIIYLARKKQTPAKKANWGQIFLMAKEKGKKIFFPWAYILLVDKHLEDHIWNLDNNWH